MSGAKALSRLIVALIETLGQHDKAGQRPLPGWPHGTVRTAFGPTPLSAEIERAWANQNPDDAADVAGRQQPAAPSGVAPEAGHGNLGRAARSEMPNKPEWLSGHHANKPLLREAPDDSDEEAAEVAALATMPAWQRPFQAAPGVRFMRTPDHLLRGTRPGPIAPIAPASPDSVDEDIEAESDRTGESLERASAADHEVIDPDDLGDADGLADAEEDDDWLTIFDTRMSEDVELAYEDRAGSGYRALRRLSMTSGFSVAVPAAANDPARETATANLPTASKFRPGSRQPFAVAVRAKPKALADKAAGAGGPDQTSAPASTRVSLQAAPARAVDPRMPRSIEWDYPGVNLLEASRRLDSVALTADALEQNARLLETTLEDFGIRGEIIHVRAGPVVTLYELEPAPGTKSSRVIGLADDIARSMSAVSARVAVVPGRNAIGIELPNDRRETVYFRDMVETEEFGGSKHKLAIALGKTIGGEPVVADLAKMPHLLVAGTTGSGKSVAINTMILSLLYRLKPEECRLIMVDPKMLELSVYDGIPHLLTPVVTDPKKAVVALKWAVREMEDRYKKMAKLGVRNIDGFNSRVTEAVQRNEPLLRTVQTGYDPATGEAVYEHEPMELTRLPYIVVIVDEMADLMMVAGKDIEGAIQRLAQMARAAGIHLIMATQRPSVDVITGTIKANFPTRISFQVTSKIDSRTILGEMGAEQLLGQGDMLYMAGGGRIGRIHGPFVSDGEVERVVAHLKSQGQPDYLDAITVESDLDETEEGDEAPVGSMDAEEGGNLYDRAVAIVLRDRKCSTSYVQRRLSVGYNKAASLVERMEREGVVSSPNHSGKRAILVGGGVDRGAFELLGTE